MFADRFDTLMNISKVSNTQLEKAVRLDRSYIGRLRNGSRPLPVKQSYIPAICTFLAGRIIARDQLELAGRLTGIRLDPSVSREELAAVLESYLLGPDRNGIGSGIGRFVSGFTSVSAVPFSDTEGKEDPAFTSFYPYLYGNEGKRKAVEQFFLAVLAKPGPEKLLLFSEENMEWLYEDPAFAERWAGLFRKVIGKGCRIRIIHTVRRNMSDILEAVRKWIPIYMTGAIEPYYYPRMRDDLFQHTLFIAPGTAAVISRSVNNSTAGMLNEFITDRNAISALTGEYERYLSLCRPLVRIFTPRDRADLISDLRSSAAAQGDLYIRCSVPPLFAMPEDAAEDDPALAELREKELRIFRREVSAHSINLLIPDPADIFAVNDTIYPCERGILSSIDTPLSSDQYMNAIRNLAKLEKLYPGLHVHSDPSADDGALLLIREESFVMMSRTEEPFTAFMLNEQNMRYAFEGFIRREFAKAAPSFSDSDMR